MCVPLEVPTSALISLGMYLKWVMVSLCQEAGKAGVLEPTKLLEEGTCQLPGQPRRDGSWLGSTCYYFLSMTLLPSICDSVHTDLEIYGQSK